MANSIESGRSEVVSKKPEVPPGKILVEAVHAGYWGAADIEKGECFLIPIEPLDERTGLPRCYSDFRKTITPGRSGWMKPIDEIEMKKITDLEAAFAKKSAGEAQKPAAAAAPPPPPPPPPSAKPEKPGK